jgi:tungstate transport system permease protein
MDFLLDGIARALTLILTLNREIVETVYLSLRVSGAATGVAGLIGLPIGFVVAVGEFRGKRLLTTLLNTLMAMPTVTAGLLVYAFLSRRGPLGELGLLMTPAAIVIGQAFLATPIITALTVSAVSGVDPRVARTARSLGANEWRVMMAVLGEARYAIAAAVAAGFGRVVAEVGAAMILGGNIKGFTRTLTTAIATETSKGDFGLAMALGLILITLAFSVNLVVQYLQSRVP